MVFAHMRLRWLLVAALLATALGTVATLRAATGDQDKDQKKSSISGPTYASDAERQSAERQAASKVDPAAQSFPAEFAASGRDLRSLPADGGFAGPIATWGPALSDAIKSSAGVVRGTVTRQRIGEGYVQSKVEVERWLVGGSEEDSIELRQVGGPSLNNGKEAIFQLQSDPILFAGRTYLLFLTRCEPSQVEAAKAEGFYCTMLWGRQFEIQAGVVRPVNEHEPWTKAAASQSIAAFEGLIRAEAALAGR